MWFMINMLYYQKYVVRLLPIIDYYEYHASLIIANEMYNVGDNEKWNANWQALKESTAYYQGLRYTATFA